MPRMFRSMRKEDDDKPTVGQAFCTLGVRLREIDTDGQNNVVINDKGMSVAPEWRLLSIFVLPRRLHPRGRCTAAVHCFRRGAAPFQQSPFGNDLELLPDAAVNGVVRHGVVRPTRPVPVPDYQQHLADTREEWEIDET